MSCGRSRTVKIQNGACCGATGRRNLRSCERVRPMPERPYVHWKQRPGRLRDGDRMKKKRHVQEAQTASERFDICFKYHKGSFQFVCEECGGHVEKEARPSAKTTGEKGRETPSEPPAERNRHVFRFAESQQTTRTQGRSRER